MNLVSPFMNQAIAMVATGAKEMNTMENGMVILYNLKSVWLYSNYQSVAMLSLSDLMYYAKALVSVKSEIRAEIGIKLIMPQTEYPVKKYAQLPASWRSKALKGVAEYKGLF